MVGSEDETIWTPPYCKHTMESLWYPPSLYHLKAVSPTTINLCMTVAIHSVVSITTTAINYAGLPVCWPFYIPGSSHTPMGGEATQSCVTNSGVWHGNHLLHLCNSTPPALIKFQMYPWSQVITNTRVGCFVLCGLLLVLSCCHGWWESFVHWWASKYSNHHVHNVHQGPLNTSVNH